MTAYSYTRADRIRKRSEFLHLSRTGKRVQNSHFIANYGTGRTHRARLGITVTKKVGGAVTRNRIKRCVREFFRKNRGFIKGTLDINVIAKKSAADLTGAQIFTALQNLFGRFSL